MKDLSATLAALREDYASHTLDESDTAADPLEQFNRWFGESLAAQVSEPNAMTLATVQSSGRPAARVVLLKSLSSRGFEFFTNYESAKSGELAGMPFAAAVLNWLPLQRQIRLEGRIERLGEAANDAYFAQRPYLSQLGAWASPQSKEVPGRQYLEERMEALRFRFPEGQSVPRPEHWGGFVLIPDKIEFWQGRRSRLHDRICYLLDGGSWRKVRLAP